MDENTVKRYPKGDFTVVWKPGKCIHAAECVRALPAVYHPKEKPWITLENASVDELKTQIAKCPSGALSWEEVETKKDLDLKQDRFSVNVIPNGPLMVKDSIHITAKDGSIQTKDGPTAFCRCGASGNKPFCDGSHKKIDFKDE